jgi:hypothetical protein
MGQSDSAHFHYFYLAVQVVRCLIQLDLKVLES